MLFLCVKSGYVCVCICISRRHMFCPHAALDLVFLLNTVLYMETRLQHAEKSC